MQFSLLRSRMDLLIVQRFCWMKELIQILLMIVDVEGEVVVAIHKVGDELFPTITAKPRAGEKVLTQMVSENEGLTKLLLDQNLKPNILSPNKIEFGISFGEFSDRLDPRTDFRFS